MRQVHRVILSAAIVLATAVSALAQVTTSTLVGLVRDASERRDSRRDGRRDARRDRRLARRRERLQTASSCSPRCPPVLTRSRIELTGFKSAAEPRHAAWRRPDRASDVHARSRSAGGNGDRRRRSAADRNSCVSAVRQPRIAGSARAAGQPPQPDEPDEPDGRRQRRAATAWCR